MNSVYCIRCRRNKNHQLPRQDALISTKSVTRRTKNDHLLLQGLTKRIQPGVDHSSQAVYTRNNYMQITSVQKRWVGSVSDRPRTFLAAQRVSLFNGFIGVFLTEDEACKTLDLINKIGASQSANLPVGQEINMQTSFKQPATQ
ncbi:hypothetical protein CSKR_203003 [Clonorchis sinensis]|uniref:Uncharacterized protein n=1 Tax=Clonorchis sinensis TaxID=79923 RepID=A0A8T1M4U7_CLOSI|nr:hypothetical protein CSKR_203003 [Clonorchis sinensis]